MPRPSTLVRWLLLALVLAPCSPIRIKDFGGITTRFEFGLGMGDEPGFPHSISNTNKAAPPSPHLQVASPLKAPVKFSRSGMSGDEARKEEDRLQRRSSSVMPFPLNLFVPRASKETEAPREATRDASRARRDSSGPPKYRRFQSTSGEELPPVIPAQDNKGYWVRLPVEQVVKDGRHAGVRFSH